MPIQMKYGAMPGAMMTGGRMAGQRYGRQNNLLDLYQRREEMAFAQQQTMMQQGMQLQQMKYGSELDREARQQAFGHEKKLLKKTQKFESAEADKSRGFSAGESQLDRTLAQKQQKRELRFRGDEGSRERSHEEFMAEDEREFQHEESAEAFRREEEAKIDTWLRDSDFYYEPEERDDMKMLENKMRHWRTRQDITDQQRKEKLAGLQQRYDDIRFAPHKRRGDQVNELRNMEMEERRRQLDAPPPGTSQAMPPAEMQDRFIEIKAGYVEAGKSLEDAEEAAIQDMQRFNLLVDVTGKDMAQRQALPSGTWIVESRNDNAVLSRVP